MKCKRSTTPIPLFGTIVVVLQSLPVTYKFYCNCKTNSWPSATHFITKIYMLLIKNNKFLWDHRLFLCGLFLCRVFFKEDLWTHNKTKRSSTLHYDFPKIFDMKQEFHRFSRLNHFHSKFPLHFSSACVILVCRNSFPLLTCVSAVASLASIMRPWISCWHWRTRGGMGLQHASTPWRSRGSISAICSNMWLGST